VRVAGLSGHASREECRSCSSAWAIKKCVLHYGGMPLYRAVRPFFLGLILGDYIVPTLWAIWGLLINAQMYMSFPH
jgi:hypothetical protein